jgi:ATP-dependent DNA helicase RecQ
MPASPDTLRDDLKRLFGHDDFRVGQREIVESVLAGRDTLAVMPTGGGKSLTYQLPAMLLPGATLVLSPLIALMKDQAENLPPEVAAQTTVVNSSLSPQEVIRRLALVRAGRIKMIYAAPERLRQAPFLHALAHAGVSLVVIDEAHCISQWGHDFRPDYRAVGKAIAALNPQTVLAATATATGDVQDDIERQLGRSLNRLVRPTYRDNLFLHCAAVRGEDEKLWTTLELCRNTSGAGLVYAGSRDKCEQLARMLSRHGVSAGFYHARLPPEERAAAQDRFMSGEIRVMVATVAFGMGVDKSDIRFLIHYHPSRTLENYYQEAGRAGRDGAPSRCTLLYSGADAASATRHLREDTLGFDDVKSVYGSVRQLMGRRVGPVAFDAVARNFGGDEGVVRSTLPLLEEAGLIVRHADIPRDLTLFLGVDTDSESADPDRASDWDLFSVGLASGDWNPAILADATGVPLPDLEATLLRFQEAGKLSFRAAPRDMLIELLPAPADTKERLQETLVHRARGAQERVQAMQDYARERRCRHGQIARYFGDRWPNLKCGQCDVCAGAGAAVLARADDEVAKCGNPALAALQIVRDLAEGYRPFAVGKPGLVRALRGAPDAPIKPERTPAFGALANLKKTEIERLVESLVEHDLLRREDEDEYRRLYLSPDGRRAVDSGEVDIAWRLPTPAATNGSLTRTGDTAESDADDELIALLKSWRRDTALEANVPPYVVFADKVLVALAERLPANEFELLEVAGIGPAKAARYGPAVLGIVEKRRRASPFAE